MTVRIPLKIAWPLFSIMTFVAGCGGFVRTMPSYPLEVREPKEADRLTLSETIDGFYKAKNIREAEKALNKAMDLAPGSALTHEMAGRTAAIQGDEDRAWKHFYLALADPGDKAAFFHLNDLISISMTATQYQETKALFEEIMTAHPDGEVRRAAAAFVASWQRRLDGDAAASEETLKLRGEPLKFAIIGAFDNEDGQGFTTEYPPEREIDYAREYTGAQLPARWRVNVPLDHQHGLSLGDLVSPGSNVVAYAATYVFVPVQGEYALYLTTTDPIRVWVNEVEVLAEQQVEDDSTDQFRVPVILRKGWNTVLMKSCHGRGAWLLGLGVTDAGGALAPGLKSSIGPEKVADGPPPGKKLDFGQYIEDRLRSIDEPMRKKYFAVQLANRAGLLHVAQDMAEKYKSASPKGFWSRLESALVSWDAGELGETIDSLDDLIKENGKDAPQLFVLRADYYSDQDRQDRARKDLRTALEAAPGFRAARNELAENYAGEGWVEDAVNSFKTNFERWPDDTQTLWGLASAYEKQGRRAEAEEVYRAILGQWRGASDILKKMVSLSLVRSDFNEAIRYQKKLIDLFSNTPSSYLTLGDIFRMANRFDEAAKAYKACTDIDDRWASPYNQLGALSYEQGRIDSALDYWQKSFDLDPDNHTLADRLEYIAPEDDTLLMGFVPDADAIKKVLADRAKINIHPGSDLIFLLDHAVEQAGPDGSSRQIVTQIITAVNDTGRDRLTGHTLPPGRTRVKEAYAIDPDGSRREASSIRNGSVRFRELKVGSTVVIQYRQDTYPGGYLSRHLFRRWFFHGPSTQFDDSHYVLIVPKEMEIKEFGHGIWKRTESERVGKRVLEYRELRVDPLIPEPFSPEIVDLMDQVILSSITSWDTIAKWDAALLAHVFRSTPKIKDLALTLTKNAKTKKEKLDEITRFVMREIRYQQDYESTISGVKPHAAPVVLQRSYGDCKDKSVLLMALAREVGIEARFALLRTTGTGLFIKELPSLQFNHAIVYVPVQDGFNQPFFIDSTPDTLDLKTLRPDSQNTWAMVIDPETRGWEFIHIPFVAAEQQYTLRKIHIVPVVDGASRADVSMTFQGPAAASVRAILRNLDDTRIFSAGLANTIFPSSKVEDISFEGQDDIVRPVTLRLSLTAEGITRRQGDLLVIALPKSENLSKFISLTERRLPLQTNLFLSLVEIEDEVVIPEGYREEHLPEELKVDNRFFSFERKIERGGDKLKLRLRYLEKQQLISPEEYPEFRVQISKVVENLGQDVVLAPVKKRK
jgi:tetratricopeptide (TPR) repeat protein/transglutaminase-like putative cysteine protease